MSKMKDVMITIQEMIWAGYSAKEVSDFTGYPLLWCIEMEDEINGAEELALYAAHSYDNE